MFTLADEIQNTVETILFHTTFIAFVSFLLDQIVNKN